MTAARRVLMLGCGGHAVAAAAALGKPIDAHVHPDAPIDDEAALRLDPSDHVFVNGLGFVPGTNRRRQVFEMFDQAGFAFLGIRHPKSNVDTGVAIADDAQIMIGATLVAGAWVGSNSIINTGAIIDHGTRVGAHSHVAPGAVLCGEVTLGDGVFVGAGAVVLPGVTIGDGAVVGAGSVVRHDLGAGARVVGVPAQPMRPVGDARPIEPGTEPR